MKRKNVILKIKLTIQNENTSKRKMWRERQNNEQETKTFAGLVTYRRLDNVQIQETF